MRLSAGRWTAVRGRSRGRETSLAPTFMLRPPLSLTKNQSCLPAAHDGRDTIFLTRTSLLPPLSPPSSSLPPCSPAGGCASLGGGTAARPHCPKPAMPAFWRVGWRVQACLRRGTDFSFSSPLSFFLPFHPWRGPLAEPAPCQ